MFHPPTSSLGWGGGIEYFNNGAMGPKRTLFYHLHIKLGHTNNKYGENKVELLHKDILRSMRGLGQLDASLHMSWLNPKLEIMSYVMLMGGEDSFYEI